MEEIPVFKWDESTLRNYVTLEGLKASNDATLNSSSSAVKGGGSTDSELNAVIWRIQSTLSYTVLDVSFVSWSDARESKTARYNISSPPCKNGVFLSDSFLAVCTVMGDIFLVADPFATVKRTLPALTNIRATPICCCWSKLQRKVQCWIGLDSGITNHLELSDKVGITASTSFEGISTGGGWLSSLAGVKRIPVIGLAASLADPSVATALYANGQARVLSRKHAKSILSEFYQLFAEGNWPVGNVYSVGSDSGCHSFIYMVADTSGSPMIASLEWDSAMAPQKSRITLPLLPHIPEVSCTFDFRGAARIFGSSEGVTLWWAEAQRKGVICRSGETLEDVRPSLDFFALLASRNASFEEILAQLKGRFSADQLNASIQKTFRVETQSAAAEVYDSKAYDRREPFLGLLKSNLQRNWDEDQEIHEVMSGFAPNTITSIVRKQGLSILVAKTALSTQLSTSVALKADDILPKELTEVAKQALAKLEENDTDQLGLSRHHLLNIVILYKHSSNGVEDAVQRLNSRDKVATFIDNFISSLSVQQVQQPQLLNAKLGRHRQGASLKVSGSLVGELVRRRAREILYECITFSFLMAYVATTMFFDDEEGQVVCNGGIDQALAFAQEAFLVTRLVQRIDMAKSALRRSRVSPMGKSPSLVRPDSGDDFMVDYGMFGRRNLMSEQDLFDEILTSDEEENFVWGWAQLVDFDEVDIDSVQNFWPVLKASCYRYLAPFNLALKTSITWFLLWRCQDYSLLKRIAGLALETPIMAGHRIFAIIRACTALWESIMTHRTDFLDAKRYFMQGAPIQERPIYFSEVARLFELKSPPVSLFFLQEAEANLRGSPDISLFDRAFEASLRSSEFFTAYSYVLRYPDSAKRELWMEKLVHHLLNRGSFDVLMSLPLDTPPSFLLHENPPCDLMSVTTKKIMNLFGHVVENEQFLGSYAFLMRHSCHQSAAEIAYKQYRNLSTTSSRNLESEITALSMCLSASSLIPANGFFFLDHSVSPVRSIFNTDVQQTYAILRALSAIQNCTKESRITPVDELGLHETIVHWLHTQIGYYAPDHAVLELCTYDLGHQCNLPPHVRTRFFRVLGERYASLKASKAMDSFLEYLVRSYITSSNERLLVVSSVLDSALHADATLNLPDWWKSVFRSENHLDVYVNALSNHGRWLEATTLALDLVPGRAPLAHTFPVLSRPLFDRLLSRADRFKFGTQESKLVTDINTDDDLQEFRNLAQQLKRKLADYFHTLRDLEAQQVVMRHERAFAV